MIHSAYAFLLALFCSTTIIFYTSLYQRYIQIKASQFNFTCGKIALELNDASICGRNPPITTGFSLPKASYAKLKSFLYCWTWKAVEQTNQLPLTRMWCHSNELTLCFTSWKCHVSIWLQPKDVFITRGSLCFSVWWCTLFHFTISVRISCDCTIICEAWAWRKPSTAKHNCGFVFLPRL